MLVDQLLFLSRVVWRTRRIKEQLYYICIHIGICHGVFHHGSCHSKSEKSHQAIVRKESKLSKPPIISRKTYGKLGIASILLGIVSMVLGLFILEGQYAMYFEIASLIFLLGSMVLLAMSAEL